MDNLDHLIVNSNSLTHLRAGMFDGLPNLKALYIDHNKIATINKDAFKGLEGTEKNRRKFRISKFLDSQSYTCVLQLIWNL